MKSIARNPFGADVGRLAVEAAIVHARINVDAADVDVALAREIQEAMQDRRHRGIEVADRLALGEELLGVAVGVDEQVARPADPFLAILPRNRRNRVPLSGRGADHRRPHEPLAAKHEDVHLGIPIYVPAGTDRFLRRVAIVRNQQARHLRMMTAPALATARLPACMEAPLRRLA